VPLYPTQGDYIWIEPISGREFDVAIGARVISAEGRRIQVKDDDNKVITEFTLIATARIARESDSIEKFCFQIHNLLKKAILLFPLPLLYFSSKGNRSTFNSALVY